MRVFIAIELPEEIKGFLSRIQLKLKSAQADVSWVKPHNIHLTLKFLGEIDEKTLNNVIAIIEDTAKDKSVFHIRLSCLGAFPRMSSPRVIWVGIDKGDEQVKTIAKELEEKLSNLGFSPEDRTFSSHFTLGRTKTAKNREILANGLAKLQNKFNEESLEFLANKITLFKSTLTPGGPIYEALKEISLKAI